MNEGMLRLILPALCGGKSDRDGSVPSQPFDDKAFITLLALLLYREKSDMFLLLALLYIMA